MVKNNSRRRKLAKLTKKANEKRAIERQYAREKVTTGKAGLKHGELGLLDPSRPGKVEARRVSDFRSNKEADANARATNVKWKAASAS